MIQRPRNTINYDVHEAIISLVAVHDRHTFTADKFPFLNAEHYPQTERHTAADHQWTKIYYIQFLLNQPFQSYSKLSGPPKTAPLGEMGGRMKIFIYKKQHISTT